MANPSTGFGGAGTEVLRRVYISGHTNTEATLITGVANHIYTVLSVVFCEINNASEELNMYVDADAAGTDMYLLHKQAIPAAGTFIFSDRFVLTETDKLHVQLQSAGNVSVWCTYIDQQLA